MNSEKNKQCKTKGCYNPVLKGKYCVQCKQKRKEKKDTILAGLGGIAIFCVAIKKSALKNIPKVAKVIKVIILRG